MWKHWLILMKQILLGKHYIVAVMKIHALKEKMRILAKSLSFMVYYLVKNVNKIDVIYEKIYICVLFCFFDYCRFGIKGKDKE